MTGEGIRRLPIARLLRDSAAQAVLAVEEIEGGGFKLSPTADADRDDFYAAWRQTDHRTRRPLSDDELARVAEVYRAALARGEPPTKTVADVLFAHRSTAGRWVMAARKAGLLPKTTERRARAD